MVAPSKASSSRQPPRWRTILPPVVIFALVLLAYYPALRGQFIWDDDYNIIKSEPLRSVGGLWRIWFHPGATQQFYPLTHTTFWLDYHLWGLHPWPYHLENILLHALSAVLLWRLLKRLGVIGAWLGAALFALHPVCVESVAWITERKNMLSCVFCIACALAAVEFWLPRLTATAKESDKERKNGISTTFGPVQFYWLALAFYVCALWSKTAMVGLPGVLLLLVWWQRGRLVRRDYLLVVPFLACGFGMGLITMAIEKHLMLVSTSLTEWTFSPLERVLIASRAFWFYLGKIVWPHPLMFMYPRWELQPANPLDWLPLAAIVAVLALLWRKRDGWGRPVLAVLGGFVAILFPVLGAFNVFFFYYSFVCDHFQYVAAIGPIALIGTGLARAFAIFAKGRPLMTPACCTVLLLVFGLLARAQTHIYETRETLWRDSIAHNPASWMAHDNLGIWLSQAGRFDEADTEYQTAIRLRPNDHVAYYDLGLEAAMQGKLDDAVERFNKCIEICPAYGLAHYELANVLARQGKAGDAAGEYRLALETHPELVLARFNLGNALATQGDLNGAMEAYAGAIEIQPDYAMAHAALGRVLAAKGRLDEAIEQFHEALESDPNSVDALANLGNALLHQGKFDEAEASYRSALRLNPGSAVLHYNLGVALSREGKQTEAQGELEQAKQLQAEHTGGG